MNRSTRGLLEPFGLLIFLNIVLVLTKCQNAIVSKISHLICTDVHRPLFIKW